MPSLTFPARFEFLDEIRTFVAQVAREHGFDDKEIYSLQLVADEAASNIIEHAYEGISSAVFEVSCEVKTDSFVIAMHDQGKPFDASGVKEPNIKASLDERQIGGLGIYIIRKLMDEVYYQSDSAGNWLTMIKHKG